MDNVQTTFQQYLRPTEFIDYNTPEVTAFVAACIEDEMDIHEKMICLYFKVRDDIWYDTHNIFFEPSFYKASNTLKREFGYCIPKAVLLAAVARKIGIPARLGYVDVTNHIASEKIIKRMGSNVFVFHSYTDLYMHGKWVKATPAFNRALCEKFNVDPLDFDGHNDSMFQQYDKAGHKYMEYIKDHGKFDDLPYNKMIKTLKKAYPHLYEEQIKPRDE